MARLPFRQLAGRSGKFDLRFPEESAVGVAIRFYGASGASMTLNHDGTGQRFWLCWSPRHFGGGQWFAVCPETGRLARVLRQLPGSYRFRTRHAYGRRAAYLSQFLGPIDRAWRTKHKIRDRLIGDLNPNDWDLPPKPKRMRWTTYERLEARYDRAEASLDMRLLAAFERWQRLAQSEKYRAKSKDALR